MFGKHVDPSNVNDAFLKHKNILQLFGNILTKIHAHDLKVVYQRHMNKGQE
jgi:hypothetical protein